MIVWAYWFIGALAVFGVLEGVAVTTHRWPTLSRTVYTISKKYLIVPFLLGTAIGGLAVHFWWMSESCAAAVMW